LLVMRVSTVLSSLLNSCSPSASTEGEQRNKRWTHAALNEARSKISVGL